MPLHNAGLSDRIAHGHKRTRGLKELTKLLMAHIKRTIAVKVRRFDIATRTENIFARAIKVDVRSTSN